jgi:nitrite reductase/ring-hydroxylating ferredoxin subunit
MNRATQPTKEHRVFNNSRVLCEGWYPVCPSGKLGPGQVLGKDFQGQRVVLFRTQSGAVHALDGFCAHFGADLATGQVMGERLRCYFHRWCYAGSGSVVSIPEEPKVPARARVTAWPVEEKYGWVWVYAGPEAPYPVPDPPGLEGQDYDAVRLASVDLYAHHHVMMVNFVDLGHFAHVHNMDMDFDIAVGDSGAGQIEWNLEGDIPPEGWKGRFAHWLLGGVFRYRVRFAGGTFVTASVGVDQTFFGGDHPVPPIHLAWGCEPLDSGMSRVHIFLVAPRGPGVAGLVRTRLRQLVSATWLGIFRDEDIHAFPRMRFDPTNPTRIDAEVMRLVGFIERQSISPWSARPGALEV